MKKKMYISVLLGIMQLSLFAQAPVNLFDPFYEDVSLWENSGLINDAPSIRPYPLQEIERLLQIVMDKGDEGQRRKAAEYKSRFFGKAFHFGGSTEFNFGSKGSQKQFFLSPFAKLNYRLFKLLTISAYISFNLMNKLNADGLLPAYSYSGKDIAYDNGVIGKFLLLPMFNSSVTVGSPEYYFTAGLGRTSYGPFHDSSIFVSRDAFHAGHFIFTINKEKWAYNQVLLLLTGTTDGGQRLSPHKFYSAHSIDFRPLSWLTLSILDAMVHGNRFDPIYLIPFSAFFLGQSIYGFPDNSLLGLSASIKPIKGLRLDTALYVDDLGFNEIIKFKSARWRMAGQFGISYTMPKTHWFSFIDFGYTFVMPYMYTHVDHYKFTEINYQNYTHYGRSLGSNLEPNSDRILLRLKFRPVHGLDINFSNIFIRHANTTESITDMELLKGYLSKQYTTDGSIFNHPTITGSTDTGSTAWKNHAFLYSTPFMKQKTIQYVNQLGLDVSCHLPIVKSGGYMLFKIGYVFEANINPGVNSNIYKPKWNEETIKNVHDDVIRKEADAQLRDWRARARSKQFNHYIRLSAEVAY